MCFPERLKVIYACAESVTRVCHSDQAYRGCSVLRLSTSWRQPERVKRKTKECAQEKVLFCVDLRQLLLIGRNESHLRWSSELPGQREGRGTILQGIRPHQRHQSEKWLWFCGKLKDFSPVTMRKLDSMRFYVAFNN